MLNPSTTHPHFSVPWPSHLAGGSGAGALGHPAACRGPGGPITSISTPHPGHDESSGCRELVSALPRDVAGRGQLAHRRARVLSHPCHGLGVRALRAGPARRSVGPTGRAGGRCLAWVRGDAAVPAAVVPPARREPEHGPDPHRGMPEQVQQHAGGDPLLTEPSPHAGVRWRRPFPARDLAHALAQLRRADDRLGPRARAGGRVFVGPFLGRGLGDALRARVAGVEVEPRGQPVATHGEAHRPVAQDRHRGRADLRRGPLHDSSSGRSGGGEAIRQPPPRTRRPGTRPAGPASQRRSWPPARRGSRRGSRRTAAPGPPAHGSGARGR